MSQASSRQPRRQLVRTYVRPELAARFHDQFPMTGAVSWLLETAMLEVLALTDGQPPLQSLVGSAIRSAVLRERLNRRASDAARSTHRDTDHELTIEPASEP